MNQEDFTSLIQSTQAATADLLIRKGAEYASDLDRLDNFKKNAALLGLSPLQVWSVYAFKHVDAVQSYMRKIHDNSLDHAGTGTLRANIFSVDNSLSEPIEGRFHDIINYMYLGLALLEDTRNSNPSEVRQIDSFKKVPDDNDIPF